MPGIGGGEKQGDYFVGTGTPSGVREMCWYQMEVIVTHIASVLADAKLIAHCKMVNGYYYVM